MDERKFAEKFTNLRKIALAVDHFYQQEDGQNAAITGKRLTKARELQSGLRRLIQNNELTKSQLLALEEIEYHKASSEHTYSARIEVYQPDFGEGFEAEILRSVGNSAQGFADRLAGLAQPYAIGPDINEKLPVRLERPKTTDRKG